MLELEWKVGFEVELLAPLGKSRQDLAEAIARRAGGQAKRCFYPQSEPSAAPGTPVFENLILGFEIYDAEGGLVCKCVDDLTIRRDLERETPSLDGWYRILSDDIRLLRLIQEQCDPDADQRRVLAPLAKLFGTELTIDEDMVRLADRMRSPIALVASLPGERERPCELITSPIESQHFARLDALLSTATELGFSVPHEAAVHLHFDAAKLRETRVFCQLVQVLETFGARLRRLVGTNTNCMRLGPIPRGLSKLTKSSAFQECGWMEARERLQTLQLTKYCDFNLMNFIYEVPGKSTFEVRILPGTLNTRQIIEQAQLFEAILHWCIQFPLSKRIPRKFESFLAELPLGVERRRHWLALIA